MPPNCEVCGHPNPDFDPPEWESIEEAPSPAEAPSGRRLYEQLCDLRVVTADWLGLGLDPLGVPPEHCNLKGTRTASFRNRGLMEKSGAERKVSHAAANGRKAPIYRITAKGRKELSKTTGTAGVSSDEKQGEGKAGPRSTVSAGTLDRPGPEVPSGIPTGAPESAADSGEPARIPGLEESAAARHLRDAA